MSHEFGELFGWIFSIISILIFLSFIIIPYFGDILFQISSKETITETINDSDSHSVRSEYSTKSEENRLKTITKVFTKMNKIFPEGIFECKRQLLNLIYGNNKNKERYMKDINGYEKKFKLIDKGKNNSKGSVKFKENEEFLFFD